jgi:hypothetical protein
MLLLLLLLSALTTWLDVISEDNLPIDILGKETPTISVIARRRPKKLQRFVYLLFDDMFR